MLPTTTVHTWAEVTAKDFEQVLAATGARLVYDVADPWAVTLALYTSGDGWLPWMFARSLLTDAMVAGGTADPIGDGDVRIISRGTHVLLELESPSGHAFLRLSRADVDRLLDEAEQLVPEGSEVLDWDSEITLLAGEDA